MVKPQVSETPGAALVSRIRSEMAAEGLEPTALEEELLVAAGALQDRIAALEDAIEDEGLTCRSKSGVVHLHPAVGEVRQTRSLLRQVLGGINMEDDDKDPVKVKAAQSRWRAHNETKRALGG